MHGKDAILDFVEGLFRVLAMLSIIEEPWNIKDKEILRERFNERLRGLKSHLPQAELSFNRHVFLYPDSDRITWTPFDLSFDHCQSWYKNVSKLLETKDVISVEDVENLPGRENFEIWKYDIRKAIKLRVRQEFPNSPASDLQRIIDQASLRVGLSEQIHNVRLGVSISSFHIDMKGSEENDDGIANEIALVREAISAKGDKAKFVIIAEYIRNELEKTISNGKLILVLEYLRSTGEYKVPGRRRNS